MVVFLGGEGVPPNFRGGVVFGGGGGPSKFSRGGCYLGGGPSKFSGVGGGSSKFSGGCLQIFGGSFFGGGSPPEYGQRSAGTHPTGMHSCRLNNFGPIDSIVKSIRSYKNLK